MNEKHNTVILWRQSRWAQEFAKYRRCARNSQQNNIQSWKQIVETQGKPNIRGGHDLKCLPPDPIQRFHRSCRLKSRKATGKSHVSVSTETQRRFARATNAGLVNVPDPTNLMSFRSTVLRVVARLNTRTTASDLGSALGDNLASLVSVPQNNGEEDFVGKRNKMTVPHDSGQSKFRLKVRRCYANS